MSKVQIRQGVFETNSSSEHSIAIVNENDFEHWTKGELCARCVEGKEEAFVESGNIWSRLYHIEFCPNDEKDKRNIEFLESHYWNYLNPKDKYHPFDNPNSLIQQYKDGELSKLGLQDLFCSYDDYTKHGFDGEDYPYEFAHKIPDNKVLFGAHYHT